MTDYSEVGMSSDLSYDVRAIFSDDECNVFLNKNVELTSRLMPDNLKDYCEFTSTSRLYNSTITVTYLQLCDEVSKHEDLSDLDWSWPENITIEHDTLGTLHRIEMISTKGGLYDSYMFEHLPGVYIFAGNVTSYLTKD